MKKLTGIFLGGWQADTEATSQEELLTCFLALSWGGSQTHYLTFKPPSA